MSIVSDVEWSLKALDEDVEDFIGVADVISVDKPVEWIFDEDVDCTTANEKMNFKRKCKVNKYALKIVNTNIWPFLVFDFNFQIIVYLCLSQNVKQSFLGLIVGIFIA